MTTMEQTVAEILRAGAGILAADESTGTIEKRFKSANIPNVETNRRDYREMLFTTKGMEQHISGVILFDETLRQKSRAGVPLAKLLADKGVVPGIKVDAGTTALHGAPGELVTQGLVKELPVPPVEFAIIAGARGNDSGWNPFIPGDDDGTVTVASTRLVGAADFATLPTLHHGLTSLPESVDQVRRFLATGCLRADGERQPIMTAK